MESNHTPGPWFVGKNSKGDVLVGGKCDFLKIEKSAVANCENSFRPATENRANAHLIAVAPEMLAALKLAEQLRSLECNILTNHKLDVVGRNAFRNEAAAIENQIRYVIAKAEGRKP